MSIPVSHPGQYAAREMLIVHGRHRFAPKKIAYRNDYCLSCERESISEQWRSFDFIHVFWIPLIPLGHRLRWTCVVCGNDPRERVKTSKFILFIAAALLVLFMVVFLFMPTDNREDAVGRCFIIFVLTGLLVWVVRAIIRQTPPPDLRNELTRIRPWADTTCIYCQGRLWHDGTAWCCQRCQLRRLDITEQSRNP